MRPGSACVVILSVVLASCTTSSQPDGTVAEQPVWGRVDCQRISGNPKLEQEVEQHKAICMNRAEAAAIAGTTSIPVGYGVGGAIASGIQRGTAQNQIAIATAKSCMGEYGYIFRTRDQHITACAAIASAASTQSSQTKPGAAR